MCPTCKTTLDQSTAPIAEPHPPVHLRADRRRRHEERDQAQARGSVRAGDSRRAVEARASTCSPGCCRSWRSGWARRCSPGSSGAGRGGRGAERRRRGRRADRPRARAPARRRAGALRWLSATLVAFLAGLVSVITPCVLPLVPGYLSAISAVEANRLGEPGVARRVVVASLPFVLGFTVVFVAARRRGGGARQRARQADADRVRRLPADRDRARVRRAAALAGACGRHRAARPRARLEHPARRRVRGLRRAVHRRRARLDPRARRAAPARSRAASLLLADVLDRPRRGVRRSPGSRSRRRCRRSAGSATATGSSRSSAASTLIALGLLLFFERYWWLQVALNRVLESVGLDRI